ncbi:MAG: hypothetical protein ACREVE_09005 [Gammaproteobacteria bacterium]
MDEQAWAGWAAAKMLTESIAPTDDPERLLEHLNTKLVFDGHKGADMSFRPNGQLGQKLLLVDDDKVLGEAPVRGVVDPANLDSLGYSHCPGHRGSSGNERPPRNRAYTDNRSVKKALGQFESSGITRALMPVATKGFQIARVVQGTRQRSAFARVRLP